MIISAWFDLIDRIYWIISSEESKMNFISLKFSLSKTISLSWSIYQWNFFFNIFDLMKNLDPWLLGGVLAPTLIRPWIFRFDHPWSRSSHDLIWLCWFHQSRYWTNRNVGLCHLINSNYTSWILSPLIVYLYLILWNRWRNLGLSLRIRFDLIVKLWIV